MLLFFEDLSSHTVYEAERGEILACHERYSFYRWPSIFNHHTALSTAKRSQRRLLFHFFFFLLFFSFAQVVYRSVERVDGCQRRNDTAAFDAVDIVAAWLVLNGTLRVHVYELPPAAGAMDSLVEDISPGLSARVPKCSNTTLHGRSDASLEKFVQQISRPSRDERKKK